MQAHYIADPIHHIDDGFAAYSGASGIHPIDTGVPWKKSAAGSTAPTLTFITQIVSSATTASLDFGAVTVSTPGLLIGVYGCRTTAAKTISNISVAGSTVTPHTVLSGTSLNYAVFSQVVSSGTNNITVVSDTTFGAAANGRSVDIWLMTNYSSTVPTDTTGAVGATTGGPLTVTLDITSGGFAVYGGLFSPVAGVPATANISFSAATPRAVSTNAVNVLHFAADKASAVTTAGNVETITISTGTAVQSAYGGGAWR